MKKSYKTICYAIILVLTQNLAISQGHLKYPDFESRKLIMIDSIAAWAVSLSPEEFKDSEDGKYGAFLAMALFETGHIEKARELTEQQLTGSGAMFREFGTMSLFMQYQHLYGDELREKVKQDQLKSNFFNLEAEPVNTDVSESHRNPRLGGASENHKLMYASAAYLAGIAWPNDYPKAWFQAGYDHLMHWFDIVTSIGFWEEDSPTYLIHHMGPVLSVAEFAPEGSEMKRKAQMVLDWYFLSVAGEYLKGYWITPAARDYNPMYGLAHSAETSALMWLYFDGAPQIPFPHVHNHFRHWKATIHFAVSHYEMPDIIKRIATDRDKPFVHKEYMAKNPMRPKEYCYLHSNYGMASILDEESQNIPPDMTRWKVQWVADSPEKEPCVFFMKHPREDGKWQSWRGASPAEQVVQQEDALVAVYKIDDGQKSFIEGPFRKDVYEAVEKKDGWLFLHTGFNLLAIKAVNGMEFTDERRLTDNHGPEMAVQVIKSNGKRNGLIVQAAPLKEYASKNSEQTLAKFIKDILEKTEIDASGINDENPGLTYKSLSGDLLEIEFNNYKKVNGKDLEFDNWPLLENPWMYQKCKDRELVLEHDGEKLVYDFEKWEVRRN